MSSSALSELRPLAQRHEASRRHRRWRLRGWGWGSLAFLWSINLVEPDGELVLGSLVLTLMIGGAVETALRIGYRFAARAAAAEFNHAFPMGTERDEAVALLRQRRQLGKEPGRAARRLLVALYVPVEEPPEVAEPPPAQTPQRDLSPAAPAAGGERSGKARRVRAPIPIEVSPRTGAARTSRESARAPLPLQPEAARGGEDE